MSEKDQTHKRFNAHIPLDLDNDLKDHIPWGLQSEVMRKLLEAFVRECKSRGAVTVHLLLQDQLTLRPLEECSNVEHKGE